MLEIEKLAQAAYMAYGKSTNNKNFRGEEMPTWELLPTAIQNAWIAATGEIVVRLR